MGGVADLPEQEFRRAVPSRGHVLGVVGISSLGEVAGKAWRETQREAEEANSVTRSCFTSPAW